ncbi:hypothetical protein IIDPJIOB_01142 [Aeromonas veronii]
MNPPSAILPLKQAAIASPVFVTGFSQYPHRARYGHQLLPGIVSPSHLFPDTEAITPDLEPYRQVLPFLCLVIANRVKRYHFGLPGSPFFLAGALGLLCGFAKGLLNGQTLFAHLIAGDWCCAGAHDGLLCLGQPVGLVVVVPIS